MGEIPGAFEHVFLGIPLVFLVYVCPVRSGEPQPADPIDGVAWFPVAAPPDLAFRAVGLAIESIQRRLALSVPVADLVDRAASIDSTWSWCRFRHARVVCL